ncbi:MAG TPA: ribonucleoside-diphosphate reductase subunit alpha, partial [Burkholderiales bacterium]
MQLGTNQTTPVTAAGFPAQGNGASEEKQRYAQYKIIRRNGAVVSFEPGTIAVAVTKAFLAVNGGQGAASARVREMVEKLTEAVVSALMRRQPNGGTFHIEDIQDQVELSLMRSGEHEVARAYVLYREDRARERARNREAHAAASSIPSINVIESGQTRPLEMERLTALIKDSCEGLGRAVDAGLILQMTLKDLYDGVPMDEVRKCTILAARSLIEKDPAYSYVTARLLLNSVRFEVLGEEVSQAGMHTRYGEYFPDFIKRGIDAGLLDERLSRFDLRSLGAALDARRDFKFGYLGLQTLYDRYFLHVNDRRIELPQAFFMRVAMGLSINEVEREARAIEFYNVLSSFDFMSSTPTLFNSGTQRSQLSSCYLTTVSDDLEGIYDAIKENALLSKFAGGLGNDWTPVRALGSHIKGTNGKSQGVVPFLKVVNDTAVAVNQGGKRKGAVCSYLETWHLDIEEFLELRKNTGDDRRRTHDMNTANWIPDLFMKRVMEAGEWTLLSPADAPDLHDKVGKEFEAAYVEYERRTRTGELKLFKRVPALTIWRKMLTMLFETGHPWITFKDPCNLRSPQQHMGVVHSSNLCTEITLNTKAGKEI